MDKTFFGSAIGAAVLMILMVGCVGADHSTAVEGGDIPTVVSTEDQVAEIQSEIDFHSERVKNDPEGAIGLAMLSESYLALARLKDDDAAAVAAERAARESLAVRQVNNSRAAMRLTEALLHQHRFVDAEESARLAVRLSGRDGQSIRLLGDVLLELGKYDAFEQEILSDLRFAEAPESRAVLARWRELNGDPVGAKTELQAAANAIRDAQGRDVPAMAWYITQQGWVALRHGDLGAAKLNFEEALRIYPSERRALAGMTRWALDAGHFEDAIGWADRANDIAPLTDVLGWKLLALKELGNDKAVEEVFGAIQELNSVGGHHHHAHGTHSHSHAGDAGRHTHNRLYAQVLSEFGKDLQTAHHAAEEDLQWRKDIYAFDTFAWATFLYWKNDPKAADEGDVLLREAQAAMKQALRTGSQDIALVRHAEQIFAAQPRRSPSRTRVAF